MSSATAKASALQRQIDLTQFLNTVTSGEIYWLESKENPPWYETGKIYEISQESFWFHLELVPPRWMSRSMFVFCEGGGAFQIFWEKQNRYFTRVLSGDETHMFCRLSGASRDS